MNKYIINLNKEDKAFYLATLEKQREEIKRRKKRKPDKWDKRAKKKIWNRRHYVKKYNIPDFEIPVILPIEPTLINFNGTDEPIVCSKFGCKTHLSLTEILAGTKCLSCQGKQKIDVNKVLSYPQKQSA